MAASLWADCNDTFLTEICSYFQTPIIADQTQFARGFSPGHYLIYIFPISKNLHSRKCFRPMILSSSQNNSWNTEIQASIDLWLPRLYEIYAPFNLWTLTAKFGTLNKELRLHIQSRCRIMCLMEKLHKTRADKRGANVSKILPCAKGERHFTLTVKESHPIISLFWGGWSKQVKLGCLIILLPLKSTVPTTFVQTYLDI